MKNKYLWFGYAGMAVIFWYFLSKPYNDFSEAKKSLEMQGYKNVQQTTSSCNNEMSEDADLTLGFSAINPQGKDTTGCIFAFRKFRKDSLVIK